MLNRKNGLTSMKGGDQKTPKESLNLHCFFIEKIGIIILIAKLKKKLLERIWAGVMILIQFIIIS